MEYYKKLLNMRCFSREDVAEITGNIRTADTILYSYKKRELISAVRRNLYTAVSLETGMSVCSAFEIASFVSPNSYVSHHSAFEYYGMANQVFSEIYVSSSSRFNDFEFEGKRYIYIKSKINDGVKNVGNIRITDLERTIIDSIKDFSKIGGLEELFHCLSMVTYVSEEKIIEYLDFYDNCFLWQKAGYILSFFPDIKLTNDFFNKSKRRTGKSVRYLYEELKNESHKYVSEWGLYVPKDIGRILDEGGQELV